MKKTFLSIAGIALFHVAHAVSPLPFYESFPTNYGNGTLIGTADTTNIWDIGNSGSSGGAVVTNAAALSFSGLATSNSYGLLISGTPGSNRNKAATFTSQTLTSTNPSVYASFLLNVESPPATNRLFAALSSSSSGTGPSGAVGVWLDSSSQLLISKNSTSTTSATNTPVLSAGTHLVVLRYKWNSGTADDEVSLWVDPGSLGVDEGSVPPAAIASTNGSDVNPLQSFWILHPTTATVAASLNVDEIRVGTNWAQVTPPDGVTASTNQPYITQALLAGNSLILRGTNGTASGIYQVLSSTDATTPRPSWPSIATNQFDPAGNFDCTNPVPPTETLRFYTLLVGGELPPPPVGPSIMTQPTNKTVITGQNASFVVFASGDPTLYYQWFINTNTPLDGRTAAMLTLTNVSTNDAGYYSVRVSNSVNSVVSTQALLTVLVPPSITADPTNLTVLAGSNASFTASASGSAPLAYQWFFNTNTALQNATNNTLLIANSQSTNEGAYSLRVTNLAGSVTSLVATLTVNSKPTITGQPQNLTVTVSNNATFTVTATGTAPLWYQWYFNTNTSLVSATNASLTITNAQTTNAGGYSVIITNIYGATTSVVATLTVNTNTAATPDFGLYGFGQATTGGGIVAEGTAAWVKVTNALDFAWAISNKSGTIKVIEIMNDLDLGYNEVSPAVQAFSIFREHATPKLHPKLIQTGVSLIDIQNKNGLTIFSANGATIRHATFNIKASGNIIVRNLKFDEMWEWDEDSKGDYDGNDWDFIDLGNAGTVSNIWIDHCTFTKAYDGISDIKDGSFNITFSWNKVVGDDSATNPNSFVWQQINSLESNKTSYAMYNYLRTTSGFTPAEIVTIIQGHDKTHLVGANSGVGNANNAAKNAQHSLTFHHQWFQNCWDRCVPRLRGGNVHNYNIYVDDTQALAAKRLRDQHTISSTYSFNPFLNGSISTENGAVLLEKSVYVNCITPLRNNQTDTNNPAYTGKIMALDSIYHFDNTNGTSIDYRGDSTNALGHTYFGPNQATNIVFSWNLPGGTLPYSYTPDDPSQLLTLVSNYSGSGVLTWAKTNWLRTSYAP